MQVSSVFISELIDVHQGSSDYCQSKTLLGEAGSPSRGRHHRAVPVLHYCISSSTQLKNYIYQWLTSSEKIFVIPDSVRNRANQRKHILVLDMDETLVYTRREAKPNHSNYIRTQVLSSSCSSKAIICTSSQDPLQKSSFEQLGRSLLCIFTLRVRKVTRMQCWT